MKLILTALIFIFILIGLDQKEKPLINILKNKEFEAILARFPSSAEVKINENGYVYGLIQSDEILVDLKLKIENLFGTKLVTSSDIGPHISIYYEDEGDQGSKFNSGYHFSFEVKEIAKVSIFERVFYVILVESEYISHSRSLKKLTKKPYFKGVMVPLHITIGEEL